MSIEEAKNLIHTLANSLQAAMGYLELGQYDKAIKAVRNCNSSLRQLAHTLSALATDAQDEAGRAAREAAQAAKQATAAKKLADEAAEKTTHIKDVLDMAQESLKSF